MPRLPTPGFVKRARSASPKVFEAVGRHLGVPDRVLDILMAQIVLQSPRVMAIVGELEPTGSLNLGDASHAFQNAQRSSPVLRVLMQSQ
jgi:hypothetical protein